MSDATQTTSGLGMLPILATIALLGFAASLVTQSLRPSREQLERLRLERHERERDLKSRQRERQRLRVRLDSLDDDPYVVERLIRSEYDYVQRGEEILDVTAD